MINENTIPELEDFAKNILHAIDKGIITMKDGYEALSRKGFDFAADLKVIEDIGEEVQILSKTVSSFLNFVHDILPSKKTKAVLSNGEVIEEHYYEANTDSFRKRITKDEEHIKQFRNSGE